MATLLSNRCTSVRYVCPYSWLVHNMCRKLGLVHFFLTEFQLKLFEDTFTDSFIRKFTSYVA
jgi:hypothetical protein